MENLFNTYVIRTWPRSRKDPKEKINYLKIYMKIDDKKINNNILKSINNFIITP